MSSTRRLVAVSEAARLTAVVVLPTPPFWFATAMTRFMSGLLDSGRTGESSTRCRSSSSPGTLSRCTARTRKDFGSAEISSSGRLPFIANSRPPGAHKWPA